MYLVFEYIIAKCNHQPYFCREHSVISTSILQNYKRITERTLIHTDVNLEYVHVPNNKKNRYNKLKVNNNGVYFPKIGTLGQVP